VLQDHQDARALSDRRRGDEIDLGVAASCDKSGRDLDGDCFLQWTT
jgi:hypothetical protein